MILAVTAVLLTHFSIFKQHVFVLTLVFDSVFVQQIFVYYK